MQLAITAHLTVFYEVPDEDSVAELTDKIENGFQHLFNEGLFTGDADADCLTFEASFGSEFVTLLPAAKCINDIRKDLRSLGHYVNMSDDALLRMAVDQGLVDENGMYDPGEAARQYANTILEQGL